LIIHIFTYLIKSIQLLLHFKKNSNTHIGPCFYILFYHSNGLIGKTKVCSMTCLSFHCFYNFLQCLIWLFVSFAYYMDLINPWCLVVLFMMKDKRARSFCSILLVQQVTSLLVRHIHVHDYVIPLSPNL